MGRVKTYLFGIFTGVVLLGCAGASFPYRWYTMDGGIDYSKGKLLGPEPKYDLEFKECAPSERLKAPCVVIKQDVFLRLYKAHKELQDKLKACEQSQPQYGGG